MSGFVQCVPGFESWFSLLGQVLLKEFLIKNPIFIMQNSKVLQHKNGLNDSKACENLKNGLKRYFKQRGTVFLELFSFFDISFSYE